MSKALSINLTLILSILLGVGYLGLQLTQPANPPSSAHQPDVYATQVVIYHTDKTGTLYDKLNTPFSLHYPSNKNILLKTPVFTLFLKNKESWKLSAQYGRLEENNDRLQLWNNVKLEQKGASNNVVSTLKTSTLAIHLKEKTADTAAPVTITQMNQIVHAVGLHANFNTKTVRLLSQVKGQFKPEKRK